MNETEQGEVLQMIDHTEPGFWAEPGEPRCDDYNDESGDSCTRPPGHGRWHACRVLMAWAGDDMAITGEPEVIESVSRE